MAIKAKPTKETAPAKLFYNPDGGVKRVLHPDGAVALVKKEPRELPRKLWKLAIRAGCLTTDMAPPPSEDDTGADAGDDAFERREKIADAMREAVDAVAAATEAAEKSNKPYKDPPGFEGAFTANDIPQVAWLEKRVGFGLDATERDSVWAEVEAEYEADGEEEEEEDQE